MKRREAREALFQLVFEKEFHGELSMSELMLLAEENRGLENDVFLKSTAAGIENKAPELDAVIGRLVIGWKIERLSPVCKSILRVALYEILYMEDIPPSVSVNEAVELAKKFESGEAAALINGVLGTVLRGGYENPEKPGESENP